MNFKPTKSGGRVFECDNAFGKARVEWNADGKLVSESIEIRTPRPHREDPCVHRGERTGEQVKCDTCKGLVLLDVFACALHGRCFIGKTPTSGGGGGGERSCRTCGDYQGDPSNG